MFSMTCSRVAFLRAAGHWLRGAGLAAGHFELSESEQFSSEMPKWHFVTSKSSPEPLAHW